MIDPFLNIHSYAHVEQVMAMHGRASKDPKRYRRILEGMSDAALRYSLTESDFPVLEESGAHSLDARSKTQAENTPAGDFSTPQLATPKLLTSAP